MFIIKKTDKQYAFSDTDIWMIGGRKIKSKWYWEKSIRIQKESKNARKRNKNLQTIQSGMDYSRFFPGIAVHRLSLVRFYPFKINIRRWRD